MELVKPEFFEVPTGQDAPTTISEAVEGLPIIASYGGTGTGEDYWIERFTQIDASTYSGIFNGKKHYFNRSGQCTDVGFTDYMVKRVNANSDYGTGTSPTSGESSTDQSTATVSSLLPVDYFAQQALNGMLQNIERPFELVDADINKLTTIAYKMAKSMIMVSARERAADQTPSGSSSVAPIDSGSLSDNTEKLLNNIVVALEAQNTNMSNYVAHTATVDDPSTKKGLNDLIEAIKGIEISGGGTTPSGGTVSGITNALKGTNDATVSAALDVLAQVVDNMGSNNNHLKVDCEYSYPSKDAITKTYNNSDIKHFMTYGDASTTTGKIPGTTSISDAAKAISATITNDSTALIPLAQAIFYNAGSTDANSKATLYESLKMYIDTRIRAWLTNSGTKVTINGTDYNITAPNSL